MSKGAIYVERSKNAKLLGSKPVDSTYASIKATCSEACPIRDEGCYAKSSFVGLVNHRMDRRARQDSPLSVARSEAHAIDEAYGGGKVPTGRSLRLHVSGDSRTIKGSRLINKAVGRWLLRGGQDVWSYTHSWAHVPRSEWSNVSILASIESASQVDAVRKMGYAPAIVVDSFANDKTFQLEGCATKFIPCVAQTRGIGCSDCALCFDANRLYENNMGIAFSAHGIQRERLKRHLKVLS